MANFGFNVAEVAPAQGFDALPAGEYKVNVEESELKVTKAGTGQYLNLSLRVIEGPFQNRIIFDRMNIDNPNPVAQQIGREALSALCHACGKPGAMDSAELHNIPVIAKVVVKKDDQYGDKNEVKSYKSAGATAPAMGNAPHAQASTTAPASHSNAPWHQKQ